MGVLLRDKFPAYITWDVYLENQRRIQQNRPTGFSQGTARRGEAILTGLLVCNKCGLRMATAHRSRTRSYYSCESHRREGRPRCCRGLGSRELDELITHQVLRALCPAAVDLSLRAAADVEQERQSLHGHWRRRLEQSRYECERIERQYQTVEPEHRRVARTLEARWDEALRNEQQLREDHERFLKETPDRLSDSERSQIVALSESIPTLWFAPATTARDRKQIIRCLVEKIVVDVGDHESVDVTIHWTGGFTSQHEIARSVSQYEQLQEFDQLVTRIRTLHAAGEPIPAIARQLNEEGFTPPRRVYCQWTDKVAETAGNRQRAESKPHLSTGRVESEGSCGVAAGPASKDLLLDPAGLDPFTAHTRETLDRVG